MLDWATNIIDKSGYFGVFLGMFLENIFPPIPSEFIMFFSGASASKGDMNLIIVIIAGIIGSAVGLLPWYYAGKWFGEERLKKFTKKYGKWLTISSHEVDKADKWFENHGKKAVVIGRFLPAVRTLIAVPAAVKRMKLSTFIFLALVGSSVYDGAFAIFGYFSEESSQNSEIVKTYINVSTYIILGIVLIWYLYRVTKLRKNKSNKLKLL